MGILLGMGKAQDELKYLAQFDYPRAGEMRYLGKRMGVEYYTPYYPDDETGFPEVYSLDNISILHIRFSVRHHQPTFHSKCFFDVVKILQLLGGKLHYLVLPIAP